MPNSEEIKLLQTMADALDMMRLAGMESPFGSVPRDKAQAEMQAEIYLVAIREKFSKNLTSNLIIATTQWFTTRRSEDGAGYKVPSAPEFAHRVSRVWKEKFTTMVIGQTVDEHGYIFSHAVDVPKNLDEQTIAELIATERNRIGIPAAQKALTTVKNDFRDQDLEVPKGKTALGVPDDNGFDDWVDRKMKLIEEVTT